METDIYDYVGEGRRTNAFKYVHIESFNDKYQFHLTLSSHLSCYFTVVKAVSEKKFINLSSGIKIWTLIFNKDIPKKTPLVIVHGMAGGVGLWVRLSIISVLVD